MTCHSGWKQRHICEISLVESIRLVDQLVTGHGEEGWMY